MISCNPSDIKITVYFIRHGFSCANSLYYYGRKGIGRVQKSLDPRGLDPELTHYAINQIENERDNIVKIIGTPNIVLSSILLRAIQTGRYLFPDNKIIASPFLKEVGFGVDNTASSPKKQILRDRSLLKHVNYDLVSKSDNKFESRSKTVDYNKFMYTWLPSLLKYILLREPVEEYKDGIKIAIIGHSGFMKKYIKSQMKNKPNNIGIVELHFCFNLKDKKMSKVYCDTIVSLQGTDCDITGKCHANIVGCDRLIYHGFPTGGAEKENFINSNGDKNCYYT